MKSKAGQRPHLGSLQDFEKSLTCMAHEQQASMRTNHQKAARQWTRMYDAPIHAGKCMDAVIVHLLQVPVSALTTQKLWDPSRARRQPWGFQEGCNVISAQAGALIMSQQLRCTARSAASAGSSELPLSAAHCAAIWKEDTEGLPRLQPRSHANGLQSHTVCHCFRHMG